MRGFIFLFLIFMSAAQVVGVMPERRGWKWGLTGTLLFLAASCLLAGIGIGLLED